MFVKFLEAVEVENHAEDKYDTTASGDQLGNKVVVVTVFKELHLVNVKLKLQTGISSIFLHVDHCCVVHFNSDFLIVFLHLFDLIRSNEVGLLVVPEVAHHEDFGVFYFCESQDQILDVKVLLAVVSLDLPVAKLVIIFNWLADNFLSIVVAVDHHALLANMLSGITLSIASIFHEVKVVCGIQFASSFFIIILAALDCWLSAKHVIVFLRFLRIIRIKEA